MSKSPRLTITVTSVQGCCRAGHHPGQCFAFTGPVPADFCTAAFVALFPYLRTVQYGGNLPWEEKPGLAHVACPDPFNPVVFRIERREEE